jgi:hypothetical protein
MLRRSYPENLRVLPEIGLISIIYSWYTDFMARSDKALAKCTGFEWDHGNITKNRDQHDVTTGECEHIFFNKPLVVKPDKEHSTLVGCRSGGFYPSLSLQPGQYPFVFPSP